MRRNICDHVFHPLKAMPLGASLSKINVESQPSMHPNAVGKLVLG